MRTARRVDAPRPRFRPPDLRRPRPARKAHPRPHRQRGFACVFLSDATCGCRARPLLYAIIGLYVVEEITDAISIPKNRWHENAHTRRVPDSSEIVVRAKSGVSGRLRRCIPIGELRNGSYRVRRDLLDTWGDMDIKDGFIQRSARLPAFKATGKFYRWFLNQNPEFIASNNPA